VNPQGDEPLIDPSVIAAVLEPLLADPSIPMSTARRRITDPAEFNNPHLVKVVADARGDALYFSRAPIPHRAHADGAGLPPAFAHIGLYAFQRDFLMTFAQLPQTPLEIAESLEQLRALEHGFRIRTVVTEHHSIGVDTPEDLERARRLSAVGVRV
jgi:3-deoxy-manno-octulosonate cytidylyltransferase (CMP-KDO synthetase)